jgi:hypothetical protein
MAKNYLDLKRTMKRESDSYLYYCTWAGLSGLEEGIISNSCTKGHGFLEGPSLHEGQAE